MIASLISHNVFYYKYTTPNELISLIFLSFVLFFFLAGSKIHEISMFLNKLVESFIWDSFFEICRHSTNTNWKFFFSSASILSTAEIWSDRRYSQNWNLCSESNIQLQATSGSSRSCVFLFPFLSLFLFGFYFNEIHVENTHRFPTDALQL